MGNVLLKTNMETVEEGERGAVHLPSEGSQRAIPIDHDGEITVESKAGGEGVGVPGSHRGSH